MRKDNLTILFSLILLTSISTGWATSQKDLTAEVAKQLVIKSDKIYDPEKLSIDSLVEYEKNFIFNENDLGAIQANKTKINEVIQFLASLAHDEINNLNTQAKEALGLLLNKIGAFYTHYKREPGLAIKTLLQASNLLTKKEHIAATYNQLGYAYEQIFSLTGQEKAKQRAYDYIEKIFSLYPAETKTKAIAFAYCLRGLLANHAKNYVAAEKYFQRAIDIYKHQQPVDSIALMRAQAKLASIKSAEEGKSADSILELKNLKDLWQRQPNPRQNPYAARTLLALSHVYLLAGKAKDARDQLLKVVHIDQNIYGDQSYTLIKPYLLLSEAYKILGDQKQAADYLLKAQKLKMLSLQTLKILK